MTSCEISTMYRIKDDIYVNLKKIDADNKSLSLAEISYIEKMQQLEYICDFRPDWFPPAYRQEMIEKLQSEFHINKDKEEKLK